MTTPETDRLPAECAIAFKEWAGVCSALDRGLQSIILRKGGIAEGPGGFVPEHHAFWLYPTRVHQGQQGLKLEELAREQPADGPGSVVGIRSLASVELIARLDRPELIPALDTLHVWTEETVEKRFYYRAPGLWVLGVRLFRLPEPVRLTVTAEHAGCKTWVPLDAPIPTRGLTPVLGDDAFLDALDRLKDALEHGHSPRSPG